MKGLHEAGETAFVEALGRVIRGARQQRRLHLRELGQLAGITGPRIAEIERGHVNTSIVRVWHLAGALGLKLSDLFRRFELSSASEAQRQDARRRSLLLLEQLPAEDQETVYRIVDALSRARG